MSKVHRLSNGAQISRAAFDKALVFKENGNGAELTGAL